MLALNGKQAVAKAAWHREGKWFLGLGETEDELRFMGQEAGWQVLRSSSKGEATPMVHNLHQNSLLFLSRTGASNSYQSSCHWDAETIGMPGLQPWLRNTHDTWRYKLLFPHPLARKARVKDPDCYFTEKAETTMEVPSSLPASVSAFCFLLLSNDLTVPRRTTSTLH